MLSLFCFALLTSSDLCAQESALLPNGSFEHWTNHDSYGFQLLYSNITVFDSFSTPTCWNYMSYPVNRSFSMYGMPIEISTNVPLIKSSVDTVAVPDSNRALRLQSFMLEDIINPVVLTIASGMLDTMLSQSVIPSILSIGEINVNAVLPLLSDVLSNTTDMAAMLSYLATVDVNDYITGGLALEDFRLSRMTGYYKYTSATSGDNGAVIMIGTRFNYATNQRDIVGVGTNMSLTDTSEYVPFEVNYLPLSDIVTGSPSPSPDSLILLLLSSAGTNMQRGSSLYVDHLEIWPEVDTCAEVLDLETTCVWCGDPVSMVLSWESTSTPDHWEIEYGLHGFQLGTGTRQISEWNSFDIYSIEWNTLHYNTWYDFYVRSVCEDGVYGEWDSIHYLTHCAEVGSLTLIDSNITVTSNGLINGYKIAWIDTSDSHSWCVQYGQSGVDLPVSYTTFYFVDSTSFNLSPLVPNTRYEVYVSALCGENNRGPVSVKMFTTRDLEGIEQGQDVSFSVAPNPAHGACTVYINDAQTAQLRLYSMEGRLLQETTANGVPVMLRLPGSGIFLLQVVTSSGIESRIIINDN